jgi:hypothetical protein
MPTIYRWKQYRFYFNSREELRKHVHVESPDGTAKFWLEPAIAIAEVYGIKDECIREIEKVIREKSDEFVSAWNLHFGL